MAVVEDGDRSNQVLHVGQSNSGSMGPLHIVKFYCLVQTHPFFISSLNRLVNMDLH